MTTKTFALTGPVTLVGRIGHGTFVVHARDGVSEASVTLIPRDPESDIAEQATVDLRGTTLFVTLPRQGGVFDLPVIGRRRRFDAVDITVTVPSGTPVKITTLTAAVTVDGRCGPADLTGGAGALTVDHVDGDLRLRLGTGSASAGRVDGAAEIRAGSGDITLGDLTGPLNAAFGSGHVQVALVQGPARIRTGSGSAQLAAAWGDVDAATGSGGLSIGLPAGRPARIDAISGTGRVTSDLPIEPAPQGSAPPITVRARTGSGEVHLFRAA